MNASRQASALVAAVAFAIAFEAIPSHALELAPSFGTILGPSTSIGQGAAGPRVPVPFGARWPVGLAQPGKSRSARAPRLRMAAGAGGMRLPERLHHTADPGAAMSVGLELPVRPHLAVSVLTEYAIRNDEYPATRQEMDDVGNLVTVETGKSVPLSMTVSVVSVGARYERSRGRLTSSVRVGLGWGHTGGSGYTGVGAPTSGPGYSATFSLGVRAWSVLRPFAEIGVLGIHRGGDDVQVVPVRLGVELE